MSCSPPAEETPAHLSVLAPAPPVKISMHISRDQNTLLQANKS